MGSGFSSRYLDFFAICIAWLGQLSPSFTYHQQQQKITIHVIYSVDIDYPESLHAKNDKLANWIWTSSSELCRRETDIVGNWISWDCKLAHSALCLEQVLHSSVNKVLAPCMQISLVKPRHLIQSLVKFCGIIFLSASGWAACSRFYTSDCCCLIILFLLALVLFQQCYTGVPESHQNYHNISCFT